MPPKDRAKAAGISASSFFDLKAELSKQEQDFAKNKAAGKSNAIVGGVKRPDKKPTVWARPNQGVNARAARDIELEAISKPTLESARAALERKAKIYDKLKRGKTGGLNDAQYDALLVDFDSAPRHVYESDSEDEDESLTVPKPSHDMDDPVVEYEDEFGRMRSARRSEVPRHLISDQQAKAEAEEEDDDVIYNPVNHFPTYEPSAERVAAIAEAYSDANNPLGVHYDASAEVRAKGAGFYQFSGDEETRRRQMEELKAARDETERTRNEVGAFDLRPGEVEGMQDGTEGHAGGSGTAKSRAMEKRKREIEERRKIVDAKRRKTKATPEDNLPPRSEAPTDNGESLVSGLNAPEKLSFLDPFAAFEAQSRSPDKGKGAKVQVSPDDFLAQLEHDLLRNNSGGE